MVDPYCAGQIVAILDNRDRLQAALKQAEARVETALQRPSSRLDDWLFSLATRREHHVRAQLR